MAQNNRLLVMGIDGGGLGLLPRIIDGEVPDAYFSWEEGASKSSETFQYQVQGHMFSFSKESVSTVGQRPPYIRYKLQCSSSPRELTVYVTYPQQLDSRVVRLATYEAFRAFLDLPDTTYMNTRDARLHVFPAQAQAAPR